MVHARAERALQFFFPNFETTPCLRRARLSTTALSALETGIAVERGDFYPLCRSKLRRSMVLVTPAPDVAQGSPENKKKTRLETSNAKDAGLRRLVEYLVVVSSIPNAKVDGVPELQESTTYEGSREGIEFDDDDEDIFIDDFDFQPKITARFPLQDHPENPLHESVTFFCYPSGSIQLRMEKSMPKVGPAFRVSMTCCFGTPNDPNVAHRSHSWYLVLEYSFT